MAEITNTSLIVPSSHPANDPGILNMATIITIYATCYFFHDLLFLTILKDVGPHQNRPLQPRQIVLRVVQLSLAYVLTIGFLATGDVYGFVKGMWVSISGAMVAEVGVIVLVAVIEFTRWVTDLVLRLLGNPMMDGI
ncbi:hypothetical protein AC578_9355 [Pseudocercospora eumusae]|uniref:Uncharacterized protein n=1 Tax=Pseudocercospora eumusae TaxID=321146 RepID=A0A139GW58_9PEZI|nr:hypothetical protein AC578_9355 [Pseudocercospora eumusae]